VLVSPKPPAHRRRLFSFGAAALAMLAAGCGGGADAGGRLEIRLAGDDPASAVVRLEGVPRALRPPPGDLQGTPWPEALRVTVADAQSGAVPAVAGRYTAENGAVVFAPLFGFDAGRRYRVEFNADRLGEAAASLGAAPIVAEVGLPAISRDPTTVVTHVYPAADVVPENQLRLYIYFSAPMGRRGGLDYVRLLDEHGAPVDDPFLPLDAEFWNGDRTRYTVFFDPGRQKRGILPNQEMGRSLEPGRTYSLAVSREWPDGDGLPLKEEFRRSFRVGPADERPLDHPRTWRIDAPPPRTRQPLQVAFAEPLDHGLLLRALGVVDADGREVAGHIEAAGSDTRWTFTPSEDWTAGGYQLKVLSILEDLAGNRIGRAFEVDEFERADSRPEPEAFIVPFRVGP
jgi:hypothetical protein